MELHVYEDIDSNPSMSSGDDGRPAPPPLPSPGQERRAASRRLFFSPPGRTEVKYSFKSNDSIVKFFLRFQVAASHLGGRGNRSHSVGRRLARAAAGSRSTGMLPLQAIRRDGPGGIDPQHLMSSFFRMDLKNLYERQYSNSLFHIDSCFPFTSEK